MAEGKQFSAEVYNAGEYGSEFEYDSEVERKKRNRSDLAESAKRKKHKVASKQEVTEEYNKDEGMRHRMQVLGLNAYDRHRKFINDYLLYYSGSRTEFQRDTSRDKRDIDVIRENHRFLWTEDDEQEKTWEKNLAKKYYDKLFKEYCIADLSRYKENKIAMRWRIEKEVVDGQGQFVCGEKNCKDADELRSWEVNFGYLEHGEKKNALVKLRLCPSCSIKLNYHHRKKEVKSEKKKKKEKQKRLSKHDTQTSEASISENQDETEPSESPTTSTGENKAGEKKAGEKIEDDIWLGPAKASEEKSRDEEFESYFEDMFL